MKNLGLLYGVKIFADTEDKKILSLIDKFLNKNMKKTNLVDNDLNDLINYGSKRLNRYPSAFRIAIAHFITLMGFVGVLAIVLMTSYFGIMSAMKQSDLNQCVNYQNYEREYPNSISEQQIKFCSVIGVEIE